jgi:hypothetical protein
MAGVGDAVVHDSAVAVDVVGHADDRNPPPEQRIFTVLVRNPGAQRTRGADGSGSVAELRWVPRLTGTNAVNLWSVFGGCPSHIRA